MSFDSKPVVFQVLRQVEGLNPYALKVSCISTPLMTPTTAKPMVSLWNKQTGTQNSLDRRMFEVPTNREVLLFFYGRNFCAGLATAPAVL